MMRELGSVNQPKGEAEDDTEKVVSKYVVFCGEVYDFFGMCWRGKRKHTPETLRISQRRGTWIVSLFLAFAAIGAFMDEEEIILGNA